MHPQSNNFNGLGLPSLLWECGALMLILALAYSFLSLLALLRHRRLAPSDQRPAVSVLKPLHGAEPGLRENLRSFFVQDYPDYELIFGVNRADDPALDCLRELQAQYPERAVRIVVDARQHGGNRKVSNLINMSREARHAYLVLADADIAVGPDYLACVVPPLCDPRVGIVTCLYRGRPTAGLWSRVAALFIDDWFAPSVHLANLLGSRSFSFGSTIALRRCSLKAIGGFEAIADRLADDFWLGELVRRQGLRTVLSDYVVETTVDAPTLRALMEHERRWMRTIRSVEPLGYAAMFPSFAMPLATLGLVLYGTLGLPVYALAMLLRASLRIVQNRRAGRAALSGMAFLPLRDMLTVLAWLRGFGNGEVEWRGERMAVVRDGDIQPVTDP